MGRVPHHLEGGNKLVDREWLVARLLGREPRVTRGLLPTGNDWLRALVRETKYGVYDAAGVALSVTVSLIAPRGLTVAEKPRGRRLLALRRMRVAMSGKVAAMAKASE